MNETVVPFYYSPKASVIDGVSDVYLALAAPVLAYWSLSLLFHGLDISGWQWLDKYRIHESEQVKSRNLVTRAQVVYAVVFQQFIQTALGYFWMSNDQSSAHDYSLKMYDIAVLIKPWLVHAFGEQVGPVAVRNLTYYIYWWFIPSVQLLFGMSVSNKLLKEMLTSVRFFIDTWQYFLHRFMHVNKFLYRHFHSWHHRLYVPYAFGSLYNHPVEGFLLDTLGAALAEALSGMTIRQAMLLFCLSTFKTVDDHCGYRLPLDPLQMITSNNADYHDIHHQVRFAFACLMHD